MSIDRSAFVAYGVEIKGNHDELGQLEESLRKAWLECRYAGDWMGCGKTPSLIVYTHIIDLADSAAGAHELPEVEPFEFLGQSSKWLACYCVS